MSSKKRSLSPEKIILLLHDIEKKLPQKRYETYPIPFSNNNPISLVALNGEAKKMMNFVGLLGFEPDCEWAELPTGTAGNILLNGSRNGAIKIKISRIYQRNPMATLAILAHEICHKLLEYHGLYYSTDALTELNEIYTEITTVFVGFGPIILAGYNTLKDDKIYNIGYLEYLNYATTLQIVEALYMSKMIISPLLGGENNAINKWVKAESKRQEYLNGFISEQKDIAECLRSLSMLQESINNFKELLYIKQRQLHEKYFMESHAPNTNDDGKPIHQFYMANPWLWNSKDMKEQVKISNISDIAKSFLLYIAHGNPEMNLTEFKPYLYSCPKCGKKNDKSSSIGKQTIVKCPDCGTKFYINCTKIDIDSINPIILRSKTSIHKGESRLNRTNSFWNFFKKK